MIAIAVLIITAATVLCLLIIVGSLAREEQGINPLRDELDHATLRALWNQTMREAAEAHAHMCDVRSRMEELLSRQDQGDTVVEPDELASLYMLIKKQFGPARTLIASFRPIQHDPATTILSTLFPPDAPTPILKHKITQYAEIVAAIHTSVDAALGEMEYFLDQASNVVNTLMGQGRILQAKELVAMIDTEKLTALTRAAVFHGLAASRRHEG